jgi:hypothetical protein
MEKVVRAETGIFDKPEPHKNGPAPQYWRLIVRRQSSDDPESLVLPEPYLLMKTWFSSK